MSEGSGRLSQRSASGVLWMGWGGFANAVLRLLVIGLLGRLLTPTEFGVVGAALVVIAFSETFANLGLGPAVIQRQNLEPRHIRTAYTLSLVLGFLIGALLYLLAPAAEALFRVDDVASVLRVLAWVFPVRGLGVVAGALLRRDLEFRWLANMSILTYLIGYAAIGVTAALSGWGVWALVAGTLGETTLRTAAMLYKRPPLRGRILEISAMGELARFGTGSALARLPQYVATQVDNLIVGRWLGAEALGIYGRAYQLVSLPSQLLSMAIGQPLLSSMSLVQDQRERLSLALRRAISGIALLTLPAAAVMCVLAGDIVEVVLGDQWTDAVLPLRVLAVAMLFRVGEGLSDSMYKAMGAVFRGAWRAWLFAGLVITAAAVGRQWGLVGVATGVSISYAINYVIMSQLSLSLVDLRWSSWLRGHLPALRWAVFAGGVAWGVAFSMAQWGVGSLGRLLVSLLVVSVLSLLALWRFPRVFLGEDGLWLLRLFRSLLPASLQARLGGGT